MRSRLLNGQLNREDYHRSLDEWCILIKEAQALKHALTDFVYGIRRSEKSHDWRRLEKMINRRIIRRYAKLHAIRNNLFG